MTNLVEKLHTTYTVAPNGVGYGGGSITTKHAESIVIAKVSEITKNPNAIVEYEADEKGCPLHGSGCIDGRCVCDNESEKLHMHRPKVAGGGVASSAAGIIGLGAAKEGASIADVFTIAEDTLEQADMPFGAHSAEDVFGDNSGCGAVDKAPEIFMNAITFKDEITGTILALTNEANKASIATELESVFANIDTYNEASKIKNSNHSGANIIGRLDQNNNCDVRKLKGSHDELRIVINTIPGTTVDQEYVRNQTDDLAQVFVVDAHHLVELADIIGSDDNEKINALLGMVVYTLATAATLTDGTLPVDVLKTQDATDYFIF